MQQSNTLQAAPGADQSFEDPSGEWTSVYVDATESPNGVYVNLGQGAAVNAAVRFVAAGTARAFPIAPARWVTFVVDPEGTAPADGQDVFIAATDGPALVANTLTQVYASIVNAVLTVAQQAGASWAVTIQNASIAVTQAVGATFNIAGNVTATIANATLNVAQSGAWAVTATIANASIAVTQAASAVFNVAQSGTWNIGAVGSITETVQGNVVNDILPTTDGVVVSGTLVTGNVGSGAVLYINAAVPDAYYDNVTVLLAAPNGDLQTGYALQDYGQARYNSPFQVGTAPAVYANLSPTFTMQQSDNAAYVAEYTTPSFTPAPMTAIVLQINTKAPVNETLQYQLKLHYASSTMVNPTDNPANMQPGQGAFDTLAYTNGGSVGGPSGSPGNNGTLTQNQTLIASGGAFRSLNFGGATFNVVQSAGNTSSAVLSLYLGGALLAQVSQSLGVGAQNITLTLPAKAYDWGQAGVSNGGLVLTAQIVGGSGGANTNITGSTIAWSPTNGPAASTTPPSLVGVVT